MRKIFKVLQIGPESYEYLFDNPSKFHWIFVDDKQLDAEQLINDLKPFLKKAKAFDFILIETHLSVSVLKVLETLIQPYNTYIKSDYWNDFKDLKLTHDYLIREFKAKDFSQYIEKIKAIAFVGQYGDKIHPKNIIVNHSFHGNVEYFGNEMLVIEGDFGNNLTQVATWKYNVFYEKERVLELWPEFEIEGNLDVYMHFYYLPSGAIDVIGEDFKVHLNELKEPLRFKQQEIEAYYAISIEASGNGKLSIGPLHRRWSRLEFGDFLMGGKRFDDGNGQEFISYFHPGDLKPPLNVYFSGYRTAEGFEGFFLMNLFKAPFLLIADPRLEGGSFYMGSEVYEEGIKATINNTLDHLGFQENDLILSGLSMGSFGALYYGAQLNPTAVIAGKPLVNVGTIADSMKLLRPNDFGTANDIVMTLTGGTTPQHINNLNQKFWNVFNHSDLKQTTFGISYMKDDDYDLFAFDNLLEVLSRRHVKTISRGIPGRHNDDSNTINNWFIHFFNIMLETKFGRVPYDRS